MTIFSAMPCRRLLRLLLWGVCWLAAAAGAAPGAEAGAGKWTLVGRAGAVELFRKPAAGTDIPALRARTRLPASPAAVFRVVSDYDSFAAFIPLVAESRVVARDAPATWVYQRLDLPLPFADRHYVIRVVDDFHGAESAGIDIEWTLDPARSRALPAGAALLPALFSGSWHLERLPGQAGCEAVYTIHADPAGAVPAWLFVRLTGRYVIQVMDAVRRRLAGETG